MYQSKSPCTPDCPNRWHDYSNLNDIRTCRQTCEPWREFQEFLANVRKEKRKQHEIDDDYFAVRRKKDD